MSNTRISMLNSLGLIPKCVMTFLLLSCHLLCFFFNLLRTLGSVKCLFMIFIRSFSCVFADVSKWFVQSQCFYILRLQFSLLVTPERVIAAAPANMLSHFIVHFSIMQMGYLNITSHDSLKGRSQN